MQGLLAALDVVVDGVVRGKVKDNQYIDIEVSEMQHYVQLAMGNFYMPPTLVEAGSESPVLTAEWKMGLLRGKCYLNKTGVVSGQESGPNKADAYNIDMNAFSAFAQELLPRMRQMFEGQGVRDRIRSANNMYHHLYLRFDMDYIELSYEPKETKGLAQWATGRITEKVKYSQLGLTLPKELPPNWAEALKDVVVDEIVNNSRADLGIDRQGAFAEVSMHSLF